MADPRIRTLKIKTGVVRRLAKEKVSYEREVVTERARVEKFRADGKDEYELRKQEEVLAESEMMVPDCQRRLLAAYNDLKTILASERDLANSEEYKVAQAMLQDAKLQLPNAGELIHMC